jgi:hypothetical protein
MQKVAWGSLDDFAKRQWCIRFRQQSKCLNKLKEAETDGDPWASWRFLSQTSKITPHWRFRRIRPILINPISEVPKTETSAPPFSYSAGPPGMDTDSNSAGGGHANPGAVAAVPLPTIGSQAPSDSRQRMTIGFLMEGSTGQDGEGQGGEGQG